MDVQALADLRILHEPGTPAPSPSSVAGRFVLQTCQRHLCIWIADGAAETGAPLEGAEAFHFLLRVLCGLESRLRGEAEVLGQFRAAFTAQAPSLPGPLRKTLRDALQKAREVRRKHLGALHQVSYGSLARHVIRQRDLVTGLRGPVRVLGAGKLARAILPHLREYPVWVWARNAEAARGLAAEMEKQFRFRPRVLERPDEPGAAYELLCVPEAAGWGAPGPHTRIHFGAATAPEGAQAGVRLGLADLFELTGALERGNTEALARAEAACRAGLPERIPA